jgi:D-glycero-D-manno-heptose 1,7-bisphosphate phosphatase
VKAGGKGEYIETPDQLRLLKGAASAIRRLNDAGLKVLVITNQRGIALGRLSTADLSAIHSRLNELLAQESRAHVDAFFYCPHQIGTCSCRKPDVGLFLQARERWPDIDLQASTMVGDSANDVIAAEKLGMTSIWLGRDVPHLAAAVDMLLGETSKA